LPSAVIKGATEEDIKSGKVLGCGGASEPEIRGDRTKKPNDEAKKVSTAISSRKRVLMPDDTFYRIDVAVALSSAESPIGTENRETNV
jgi:hypothetical protein